MSAAKPLTDIDRQEFEQFAEELLRHQSRVHESLPHTGDLIRQLEAERQARIAAEEEIAGLRAELERLRQP